MAHRLDQRFVGVQKFHVLADHGDVDFLLWMQLGIDDTIPFGEIGATAFETETFDDIVIEALGVQDARNLVDGIGVRQADHRTLFDVGKQRNLAPRRHVDGAIGAADQHVRLQADGAQLLHRMLGWLGLGFAGGGDVRHQRQVHQHGALGADFHAQLADGLEEGLRLDVAHRTADLHQGHVGVAGTLDDATLDLVGDVRDDLDGCAQVVAPALTAQHVFVDATGGEVVVLGHAGADEPLVVPQIEVVMGDEHLTVLERAHGARIDVDVRVQFEHRDLQAPRLQDGRQ